MKIKPLFRPQNFDLQIQLSKIDEESKEEISDASIKVKKQPLGEKEIFAYEIISSNKNYLTDVDEKQQT